MAADVLHHIGDDGQLVRSNCLHLLLGERLAALGLPLEEGLAGLSSTLLVVDCLEERSSAERDGSHSHGAGHLAILEVRLGGLDDFVCPLVFSWVSVHNLDLTFRVVPHLKLDDTTLLGHGALQQGLGFHTARPDPGEFELWRKHDLSEPLAGRTCL